MTCTTAMLAERAVAQPGGRLEVDRGGLDLVVVDEFPANVRVWTALVLETGHVAAPTRQLSVDVVDSNGISMGYRMSRPVRSETSPGMPHGPISITIPVNVVARIEDELTVRVRLDAEPVADLPLAIRHEPEFTRSGAGTAAAG